VQQYEFELVNEITNEYVFMTDSGISYDVAFVKAETYFQSSELFVNRTFELIIQPNKEQINIKPLKDSKLPPTIVAIFLHFFKNYERIVVFSCDTTDRKQAARHRKFSDWFLRFNDDTFLKFDGIIDDKSNDNQYYMSMILRNDNPDKIEIEEAFSMLIDDLKSYDK
jgi:Family of unknown function (DUF6169)